jgi:WD40 repeat protein
MLPMIIVAPSEASQRQPDFTWKQLTTTSTVGVNWSPSGNNLVAGLDETGEIIIVDWQTGAIQQRTTFPNQSGRMSIHFLAEWSPDSRFIATDDQTGNIYILVPETGQMRLLREPSNEYGYFNLDWSPDSQSVAALNSTGYLDIISLQTGEIIQMIDMAGSDTLRGEGLLYYNFDWSPDGNFFAAPHMIANTGNPPVVGFWERDGNQISAFDDTQEAATESSSVSPCSAKSFILQNNLAVSWANDSRTLAVSGDEGYGICRLNIDGTIAEHSISDFVPDILRWSPDQMWLAATNGTVNTCSVELAAVADDYQTIQVQIDSQACLVNGLAWSSDSQNLAASTNEGIWIGTLISS